MKLYTEEQINKSIRFGFTLAMSNNVGLKEYKKEFIDSLSPIELPSDEEIVKQSKYIAHNYFEMHHANHYQGLEEGSLRMASWLKEKILNQNK